MKEDIEFLKSKIEKLIDDQVDDELFDVIEKVVSCIECLCKRTGVGPCIMTTDRLANHAPLSNPRPKEDDLIAIVAMFNEDTLRKRFEDYENALYKEIVKDEREKED